MLRLVRFIPNSLRPLAWLALALNAADAAMWPLLPRVRDELALSGSDLGLVVATPTLAVLVTAVAVGQLGARYGARRPLALAAVLVPVSLVLTAVAGDLVSLLAARLVFGLAFSAFWTLGPTLASSRLPSTRGSATVMTAAGAGWLVGPLSAGLLEPAVGWRWALVSVAGACAAAVPLVAALDDDARAARPVRLRETLEAIRRSRAAGGALATSAFLGAVTGAVGVLVPSLLADNGVGSAGIGLVLAVSSVVWASAAAWSGALGVHVTPRLAGVPAAALALAWALPVLSGSSEVVVAFLVVAAVCRALLGAFVYPLAASAADGEAATAALGGLLNLAWASFALLAPLAAGVALEHDASRLAFAVMCVAGATVAAAMLTGGRRPATA
ncbi:MAG: MFS transporter [Gaiellales bacterium]